MELRRAAPTGPPRSPVMADVAARAGVSHQTVSRVLNSPALVRPETRRRVEDAIEQLGYRRNMSARALATRRTHLIGVVTPGVSLFGPSHTTMAIHNAARSEGYATVSAGIKAAADAPTEALDFFLTLRVEGIIVVAPTTGTAAEARRLAGTLPVVAIATDLPDPGPLHVVAIDHEQGARDATAHLIERGHRDIAHIAGPPDWFDARARIDGWRAALREAGLTAEALVPGGWEAVDGYTGAAKLLRRPQRPTAVFAANDLVALGAMRAFHEAGLRIPQDIAVVGYDDISGCDYYQPPLTTVRQPFEELGRHAINTMVTVLGGRAPNTELSRPELIVRESS